MLKINVVKQPPKFLFIGLLVVAVLLTGSYALSTLRSHFANAATDGWEAGRIIDDAIFTNFNSMNVTQIQNFLNSKVPTCDTNGTQPSEFGGGTRAQWAANASLHPIMGAFYPPFTCLKDYKENNLSAAQIIYNAAQQYQINPQVLIVLLQKEQSLVTDTWPSPTQYQSATGYACPDNNACDSQYYGLTNQVNNAARMFHAIMIASPTWYTPYVIGNNYVRYNPSSSCGGSTVLIQNRATQALYNYTPYQPNQAALDANMGATVNCGAYGNINFYRYYNSWFGSTKGIPYSWSLSSEAIYSDPAMTQQISDSSNTVNLLQGQKAYVRIRALNTGAEIWNANTIKLGTSNPLDRASAFSDSSWQSSNRTVYLKESSVSPGQVGTFEFSITAPQLLGSYREYFRPIFDGVAWFNDIGMYFNVNVNFQLPQGAKTSLGVNEGLRPGESIIAPNGRYTLRMQWDGNLVIYSQTRPIWGTATDGKSVSAVYMQGDGNLVMYDTSGRAIWSSKTGGKGSSVLYMQGDGNLVTYASSGATWGSGTNQ